MEDIHHPGLDRGQRLTRMVEEHQRTLLTMCYAYLHDLSLAEDAVQETFLRAYRTLNTFRGSSSEKTWLTRIAINVCRDMQRSAWFSRLDRRKTPEEIPIPVDAAYNQDAADLADAISQLPTRYREVILLYYYQELTMPEIAPMIGLSTSMVSRRLKQAHARLQTLLGKEFRYDG